MQKERVDVAYLQKIGKSDFYSNDREFLNIIKKLTEQSASLNNKAISLVSMLNEAEQIKLEMVQKEIELGLSQESKPYGVGSVELVKSHALFYEKLASEEKPIVERFIYVLENYLLTEEVDVKRGMLIEAKIALERFESLGINPLHFIITPERAKVWYILDKAYSNTLKKINIDFFIAKIRTTRLQHISAVDDIKEYYKNKKSNIFKLSQARENNADPEAIESLKNELGKELSIDIEPLMIDTQKIMDSLDFMLEDLPGELNQEQTRELEDFLPVLAEYYIDQTYVMSGGNAFTALAKNLQYMQKLIDENASAQTLLNEVEKLDYSMQHLYILHWIGESLLKEVLACYHHGCSIGVTIKTYRSKFADTTTSFDKIQQAVFFRNNIAHNGVLWKPNEIKISIENYRVYIEEVALERDISLEEFFLPKLDRALTKEQKEQRIESYVSTQIGIHLDDLDEKTASNISRELEECNWSLPKKSLNKYKRNIDKTQREEFASKHFEMSLEELKNHLVAYQVKNFDGSDEELQKKAMGLFTYVFRGLKEDSPEFKEKIQKLQKRVEEVSDKRYTKGGFAKWFR